MKRILIINTVPFVKGGMSAVIFNYFEHINLSNFAIDFVINKEIAPEYESVLKKSHAELFFYNRNRHPFRYMLGLYRTLKKRKYDVVHIHGNSATMLLETLPAWRAGIRKRIVHCHNTKYGHSLINKICKVFFKRTYTDAFACSKEAGQWLFGENHFDVLPNGINVKKYRFSNQIRQETREKLGLSNSFVVGHVGFMNKQKNHEKLFSVVCELKKQKHNVSLLCVTGDKEIPESIKLQIKKYGLEKNITILFQRSDVNELLMAMDVFVFPSKWEGFGVALLEAQASGLPCVVSNRCIKEINQTGRMKYVDLEAPAQTWVQAILSLQKESIAREQNNDLMFSGKYHITNCVKKLEEVYINE